jgi:hypothetical protein
MPVVSGCVPNGLAATATFPDTDEALRSAPDAASRYQLLWAGRAVRDARISELETVVGGCPRAAAR